MTLPMANHDSLDQAVNVLALRREFVNWPLL
jgi:hypothetical protein